MLVASECFIACGWLTICVPAIRARELAEAHRGLVVPGQTSLCTRWTQPCSCACPSHPCAVTSFSFSSSAADAAAILVSVEGLLALDRPVPEYYSPRSGLAACPKGADAHAYVMHVVDDASAKASVNSSDHSAPVGAAVTGTRCFATAWLHGNSTHARANRLDFLNKCAPVPWIRMLPVRSATLLVVRPGLCACSAGLCGISAVCPRNKTAESQNTIDMSPRVHFKLCATCLDAAVRLLRDQERAAVA